MPRWFRLCGLMGLPQQDSNVQTCVPTLHVHFNTCQEVWAGISDARHANTQHINSGMSQVLPCAVVGTEVGMATEAENLQRFAHSAATTTRGMHTNHAHA